MQRKKVNKMKSNIIALTQKDLHKLGQNLGGVCLGYNCYLYEMTFTHMKHYVKS